MVSDACPFPDRLGVADLVQRLSAPWAGTLSVRAGHGHVAVCLSLSACLQQDKVGDAGSSSSSVLVLLLTFLGLENPGANLEPELGAGLCDAMLDVLGLFSGHVVVLRVEVPHIAAVDV